MDVHSDYYIEELVSSTDMIQDEWLDMERYDRAQEICQEYLRFFLDLVIKGTVSMLENFESGIG